MRDDPAVIALVSRARDGDQRAWDEIVERYAPLVWISTTTARECLRVLRAARRHGHDELPTDGQLAPGQPPLIDQELLAAELRAAVRAAFTQLPDRCRELLSMLIGDPPLPYAQISTTLSIPIGGIGPQRARCLDRLRRSPSLAAFTESGPADGDRPAGRRGGHDA